MSRFERNGTCSRHVRWTFSRLLTGGRRLGNPTTLWSVLAFSVTTCEVSTIAAHNGLAKRPESGCIFFQLNLRAGDDGELFMKVLIVDDHALIREALHAVLNQLKREAVIFEASNSRQAMHIVEEHPDVSLILLDINLPDRDGFSVLEELRERYATIAIIVLSAADDQDTVKRAFKLGALGFIPKTTERGVMLNAIQLVLSGGIYIPSEILDGEETASPRSTNKLPNKSLVGLGLTDRQ